MAGGWIGEVVTERSQRLTNTCPIRALPDAMLGVRDLLLVILGAAIGAVLGSEYPRLREWIKR